MEMGKKNEKVLKKVFQILEWSSKNIIQFAGCQEELVKGLKGMLAEGDEWKEKIVGLSSENYELKERRKWLEKKVASLEARLEEKRKEGKGRGNVKGNRKRMGVAIRSKRFPAASASNKRRLLEHSAVDSDDDDNESVIFLEERKGNAGNSGSSGGRDAADLTSSDEEEASGVYVDQPVFVRRSTPMVSGRAVGARTRSAASTDKPPYPTFEELTNGKRVKDAVPGLVSFIFLGAKGLKYEKDLRKLCQLLTMTENLLNNPAVKLGEDITKLWSALVTCVNSQGRSQGSGSDRRWELQDKAVQLLLKLCKMSVAEGININLEVTAALSEVISREQAQPASLYGAVAVLGGLGNEAIRTALLPKVKAVGERVKNWLDSDSEADREAAEKLNNLLVMVLGGFIRSTKYAQGSIVAFRKEFGYFAKALQNHLLVVGQQRKRRR